MNISDSELKVKSEPVPTNEISEHVESDDEDPDAEYNKPVESTEPTEPAAEGEPEVPVKGKKKVVKKGVAC